MNAQLHCPECDQPSLAPSVWAADFRHEDTQVHVDGLECHVCAQCGADPVFPDQIRRNERRIADAKRRSDGRMTGDEVRAVRERFGLSQQEASELFGGGVNAFSKYERGAVLQSVAMDRLLKVAAFYPFVLDFLRIESRIATGAGERVAVERYQAGAKLDLRSQAYGSRSIAGKVVELAESTHWRVEAA
jgi:HTH-type transcriptional regulator/antitoxin MqsA